MARSHNMEWSSSTARPLTPNLCPPGEFARGKTANVREIDRKCYGGLPTIAYPLTLLFGHIAGESRTRSEDCRAVTAISNTLVTHEKAGSA